jgi:hypothetical protein
VPKRGGATVFVRRRGLAVDGEAGPYYIRRERKSTMHKGGTGFDLHKEDL